MQQEKLVKILKQLYWHMVPYYLRRKIAYCVKQKYKSTILKEINTQLNSNITMEESKEFLKIKDYIKKNGVSTYNYSYTDNYKIKDFKKKIMYDSRYRMYYTIRNGHPLFLKKTYNTKVMAAHCYMNICMEQDVESPHCYLDRTRDNLKGDILIDAGAAEGFFALDNINSFSRIIIIECEKEWIEALKITFQEELKSGKVEIVDRYLSDVVSDNEITIDKLLEGEEDILSITVKMDIEGYECKALCGAKETLSRNINENFFIAAYHKKDDERDIRRCLENFELESTKGYLVFTEGTDKKNLLRKGVIRANK